MFHNKQTSYVLKKKKRVNNGGKEVASQFSFELVEDGVWKGRAAVPMYIINLKLIDLYSPSFHPFSRGSKRRERNKYYSAGLPENT